MPMTREQLFETAKALDARDREILAEDLWQTLERDELAPEQLAELRRRIEAIDKGEMKLLDGEQVIADLRKRFAK